MEFEFENIGKFIQRNNIAIIILSVISLFYTEAIYERQKEIDRLIETKEHISFLIYSIEDVIQASAEITGQIEPPIAGKQYKKLKKDIYNTSWKNPSFDTICDRWIMPPTADDRKYDIERIYEYSGVCVDSINKLSHSMEEHSYFNNKYYETVEGLIYAMDAYLDKSYNKQIHLPLLNSSIRIDLLQYAIPFLLSMFLIVVSCYLFLAAKLLKTADDATNLLSNTVLYITDYNNRSFHYHFFKIIRLVPSSLILLLIYAYSLFNLYSLQLYFALSAIIIHVLAFISLDRAIIKILTAAK